jgi:hypothetical protein
MDENTLGHIRTPDEPSEPVAYSPPEIELLGSVVDLTTAVPRGSTF